MCGKTNDFANSIFEEIGRRTALHSLVGDFTSLSCYDGKAFAAHAQNFQNITQNMRLDADTLHIINSQSSPITLEVQPAEAGGVADSHLSKKQIQLDRGGGHIIGLIFG